MSAFQEELVDRFGELPHETERLLTAMTLKIMARTLHIREVDAAGKAIRIVFGESPPLAPDKVAALLHEERGRLRYIPKDSTRAGYDELEYTAEGGAKIAIARTLLSRLQACQ